MYYFKNNKYMDFTKRTMKMLLLVITALFTSDFVACYHSPSNPHIDKAVSFDNSLPLSQTQQQAQSVNRGDCNCEYATDRGSNNGYSSGSNNNDYPGSSSSNGYHNSGSGSVGSDYVNNAYNLPLPRPILNDYIDSRYLNILSPPNLVNVNGFNAVTQNPLVPGNPYTSSSLVNTPLQNPPLNASILDLVTQSRIPGYDNRDSSAQSPPVQQPVYSGNAFAGSVPPGQDATFITSGLEVQFQWRYLDWVAPTVQLTGKNFTLGNPLTQDVDIDRSGRVFVTSPQWLSGVPITLSTITNLQGPGGPLLTPYPNWSWHTSNCDGLISVYRVTIDEYDRLWMVDTGSATGQSVCQPKIVVFDLKTDKPLLIYPIPEEQTVGRTASYVNPVVEIGDTYNDTFLYVADVLGHGLLVYSLRENRSWRVSNTPGNAFGHDPEASTLNIAGETFSLTDGTLGMSLSPRGFYNKRYLYFNSLASYYQKFADSDSLKRSFIYEPIVYQSLYRRISQAGVQATSRTGATFFQLTQFTALACWNIERPFTRENIVKLAVDERTLQYISGIKVITNALGEEELWFNTNRLQKTIKNTRSINEINFRLIRGKVNDLIQGTRCAPTGYRTGEPNLQGWKRV